MDPIIEEEIKREQIKKDIAVKVDNSASIVPPKFIENINGLVNGYMETGLVLPKNYISSNAITSAYMIVMQDEKLKSCTPKSIQNTLVDMVVAGLNPAKKQCYFLPYTNKKGELELQLIPSYFGKITALRRVKGIIDVRSDVIYKGTVFELTPDEYGNDQIKIVGSCPLEERSFDNIIGAWARIIMDEEVWGTKEFSSVMTMAQIQAAWNQGPMKGKSPAHINFKDEMCKKTAIGRCIKTYINTRDDQDILIETIGRMKDEEDFDVKTEGFIGNAEIKNLDI